MTIERFKKRKIRSKKIYKAAEKIFALNGYKGATMSMIAEEAKLPKSTVLYYVQTKAELYQIVIETILDDWLQEGKMFNLVGDPYMILKSYIEEKMDFSREYPHASKIWAHFILVSGRVSKKTFIKIPSSFNEWVDLRVGVINKWKQEGIIKDIDANALLYMIWATTQHYADFEYQITVLNKNKRLSKQEYKNKRNEVVKLILGAVFHELRED
jgi:TetR/AcrR family transcriptional regulator